MAARPSSQDFPHFWSLLAVQIVRHLHWLAHRVHADFSEAFNIYLPSCFHNRQSATLQNSLHGDPDISSFWFDFANIKTLVKFASPPTGPGLMSSNQHFFVPLAPGSLCCNESFYLSSSQKLPSYQSGRPLLFSQSTTRVTLMILGTIARLLSRNLKMLRNNNFITSHNLITSR